MNVLDLGKNHNNKLLDKNYKLLIVNPLETSILQQRQSILPNNTRDQYRFENCEIHNDPRGLLQQQV